MNVTYRTKFTVDEKGFTIIEAIIVLAIVGILLLIILLFVPSIQRDARNHSRKDFANLVSAQMQSYKGENLFYPSDGVIASGDDRCNFLRSYIKSTNACSVGPAGCATVVDEPFTVCFHTKNGAHEYVGGYDEYSVELSHTCNPDKTSTEFILSTHLADNDRLHYAVWTRLEGGSVYCTDN